MADWREITAEWMGGMDFKTAGTNGVELVMGIAGEKTGVSPVEMLLMAKAGCTGMDIVSILAQRPLDATNRRVPSVRWLICSSFREYRLQWHVHGPDTTR